MKLLVALFIICTIFITGILADDVVNQNNNTNNPSNLTIPYEIETKTDVNGTTVEYVKDEVLIQFKQEIVDQPDLYLNLSQQIHTGINSSIVFDYGDVGLPGIQLLKITGNMTVDSAIAYYMNTTYLEIAQPNYIKKLDPIIPSESTKTDQMKMLNISIQSVPNDPLYSQQWALTKINAPGAWDISTGSQNTIIAIIDPKGVDILHSDLRNNIWTINTVTYTGDHGTHCTGIIAAGGNNGVGISGIMWHAKILPYQFSGTTSSSELYAFGNAKTNGATIISCSFGGPQIDPLERSAIASCNALVICSAGNGDPDTGVPINTDIFPTYPSSYNLDNIISVAASDQSDNLANFPGYWGSNYGVSSVDLAAPGVDILSTVPNNQYDFSSGTSMAAPMVVGVAGLIKSKHPELTNAQIKAAILNNVDKVPSLNGKVASGGRLNAFKALQSLETPGAITIQSNPGGAKIFLDGVDTGYVTPKTITGISVGTHTVKLS